MREKESHYTKTFDPNKHITIYDCECYHDIGFIPKEKCWDGDMVHVEKGNLKYVFKKGNWEIVM